MVLKEKKRTKQKESQALETSTPYQTLQDQRLRLSRLPSCTTQVRDDPHQPFVAVKNSTVKVWALQAARCLALETPGICREQGVYICRGEAADDFSLLWPRRWQYREKWQLSCWAGYTLWLGNEKRADTAPLHAQAQCLLFLASRPVVLSHSLLFLLHTSQTWHDWACLPGQSQSITHTCLWLEKHRNPSLQFGRRCFTRCYLVIKQCCDCSCWVCDFYLS